MDTQIKFTIDTELLKEKTALQQPVDENKRTKFNLAKQYDRIAEYLNEEHYLEFSSLINCVTHFSEAYFNGRPKASDEDDYDDRAYAKNIYNTAQQLSAAKLKLSESIKKTELKKINKAFDEAKYAYLMYRIFEYCSFMQEDLGRWDYSDYWGCLNFLVKKVIAHHKATRAKKFNPVILFNKALKQLETLGISAKQVRYGLMIDNLPIQQQFWYEELQRSVADNEESAIDVNELMQLLSTAKTANDFAQLAKKIKTKQRELERRYH